MDRATRVRRGDRAVRSRHSRPARKGAATRPSVSPSRASPADAAVLLDVGGCSSLGRRPDGGPADRGCAPVAAELRVHRRFERRGNRLAGHCIRSRLAGSPPSARPAGAACGGRASCRLHLRACVARRSCFRRSPHQAVRARVHSSVALRLALATAYRRSSGNASASTRSGSSARSAGFSCSDESSGSGRRIRLSTLPDLPPSATSRSSPCCSRSHG